ncbi:TRAP transporter small permease [Paenisporosarcina sp. TG20]|uniref:TRAP transporter small permease n=1 Tax=Paenisporosarcina sp. TG20 TaxID=1211706 RepID=UPI0002E5ACB7|nr:TRAP transporter small permease [Paenisporosarcina sp. TG20]
MKVLQYLEEIILVLALAVMTVISFANIIARNFASMSFSFTEEITINLFVLITFVGTAVGVRRYAHLSFTLLFDLGGRGFKKAIIVFTTLSGLFLFGVLFWYGIQMILFQMDIGQKTPALGWPQWILSISLPFGAFLCIIRTIQVGVMEWLSSNKLSVLKGDDIL